MPEERVIRELARLRAEVARMRAEMAALARLAGPIYDAGRDDVLGRPPAARRLRTVKPGRG